MTPLDSLCYIIRKKGNSIGFVNGCFDLLHEGHKHLLKEAKKHCDVLFVGVNDDRSVKDMKGEGRPVKRLTDRIKDLEHTGLCDGVFGFYGEDELLDMITEIKPDYLIKGEDYRDNLITGAEFVRRKGGVVLFVPLLPGFSTTALLQ